jgi:hypothetical protein
MSENTSVKTNSLITSEAPASWNTRYMTPDGFVCQLTLRGETGSELLEKAASAIAYLLKNGCTPYVYRSSAGRKDSSASETQTSEEKTDGNRQRTPAKLALHCGRCTRFRMSLPGMAVDNDRTSPHRS